jgi:hypothetical protein
MELELLILPGKMSSPKVSMVFMLLDLFPVSGGGGGQIPPFISVHLWTDISRASGILKGPIAQKFYS